MRQRILMETKENKSSNNTYHSGTAGYVHCISTVPWLAWCDGDDVTNVTFSCWFHGSRTCVRLHRGHENDTIASLNIGRAGKKYIGLFITRLNVGNPEQSVRQRYTLRCRYHRNWGAPSRLLVCIKRQASPKRSGLAPSLPPHMSRVKSLLFRFAWILWNGR